MKKKDSHLVSSAGSEQASNEPFLRRINIQKYIIKKMLSEIEVQSYPEVDPDTEVKMNDLSFKVAGKGDQEKF